jgi:hypothetical protein
MASRRLVPFFPVRLAENHGSPDGYFSLVCRASKAIIPRAQYVNRRAIGFVWGRIGVVVDSIFEVYNAGSGNSNHMMDSHTLSRSIQNNPYKLAGCMNHSSPKPLDLANGYAFIPEVLCRCEPNATARPQRVNCKNKTVSPQAQLIRAANVHWQDLRCLDHAPDRTTGSRSYKVAVNAIRC